MTTTKCAVSGEIWHEPPSVQEAFRDWLAKRKDRNEFGSYPVFLVAAEGGGLRAAYFTAPVLENLQARCPRFAQHTFLISGVSGGSVGASLFAEALNYHRASNERDLPCGVSANVPGPASRALHADLLSPLLFGLLYADFLQWFVPVPIPFLDRARFLERALDQAWAEAASGAELGERSFYSVWRDVGGAVPALMLNTTNVETGRRMVVSHLSFPERAETDLPILADENPKSRYPPLHRSHSQCPLSADYPSRNCAGSATRRLRHPEESALRRRRVFRELGPCDDPRRHRGGFAGGGEQKRKTGYHQHRNFRRYHEVREYGGGRSLLSWPRIRRGAAECPTGAR